MKAILLAVVAFFTVFSVPLTAHATTTQPRQAHDKTKLMVLLVPKNDAKIIRPSEVVEAVRSESKTDRQNATRARFGLPVRVTRLLGDHAPELDSVFFARSQTHA